MKILLAALLLGLIGCASAPTRTPSSSSDEVRFITVRDQSNYRIAAYLAPTLAKSAPAARVQEVQLLPEAYSVPVTAADAALVARHLGRSLCRNLAPYVHWQDTPSPGQHVARVQIRRIDPTGSGLSVVSALLDAFVPGPFRLPAGLGGLSAEVFWRDDAGKLLFGMLWARGANPLLQQARASAVGDAWELAPSFARDARKVWREGEPMPLSEDDAKASRSVCDAAFGTLPLAGQAASSMIPLSPAALEPDRDE